MIVTPDEDSEALNRDFEEHRLKFFAFIGHCVTSYQSVEDYLLDVFNAALGGDKTKATAIFQTVRGLEAKLNLITAALTGAEASTVSRWENLLKRVADAAKARNEIAHARTVHNGGLVRLTIPKDGKPAVPKREKPPRMELHKHTRSGANVWTLELMREEAERNFKLFRNLIAFVMTLEGKEPPAHLLEE